MFCAEEELKLTKENLDLETKMLSKFSRQKKEEIQIQILKNEERLSLVFQLSELSQTVDDHSLRGNIRYLKKFDK